MNRRRFLAISGATLLAGCSGDRESSDPSPTDAPTQEPTTTPTSTPTAEPTEERIVIGDTVTYEGLQATVEEYTTVDVVEGEGLRTTYRSGDATTIILANITVENIGDIRRTPPYTQDGSLFLTYRGEIRDPLDLSEEFSAGDKTYQRYGTVDGQREDLAIYPGAKIYGWAGFEVEDAFSGDNTAVVCGLASDDLYEEYSWYLSD